MVSTKNRSTPVVEKKEEKAACGCKDCTCGENCSCGCGMKKVLLQCGTMLVSAALVAGAVVFQPCLAPKKPQMMPIVRKERPLKPERPNLDKEMRKFIMENPQLLIESVGKYYEDQEAQEAQTAKNAKPAKPFSLDDLEKADADLVKKIVDDKTTYSLGNKDGKFVIIEFFDHQCGWCQKTNQEMKAALAKPEGKNIRWIPIDTPIFGVGSELIARYVLAAGEQGKYAEMHTAVADAQELKAAKTKVNAAVKDYIEQNNLDPKKNREDAKKVMKYSEEVTMKEYPPALEAVGKALKLNTKKLAADAQGDKVNKRLAANREIQQALEIGAVVPMLIVDGRINPGALFGERLDAVVKASANKK